MSAFTNFIQKRKKVLLISLIGLVLIGGSVPLVKWYLEVKQERLTLIKAIPQDAAVIALFNNASDTWKRLKTENNFWKQLKGFELFNQLDAALTNLDSIRSTSKEVSEIVQKSQFGFSVHCGLQSKPEFLFLMSLSDYNVEETLMNFVEKQFKLKALCKSEKFEGATFYSAFIKEKDITFYWFCKKGILAGSFSKELLKRSYHQLQEPVSLTDNPNFLSVYSTAGKKVEVNIFINYASLYKLSQNFIAPDFFRAFSFVGRFASFSGLDVLIKPNELSLTGYTSTNDSLYNYMCSFLGQESPKLNASNFLPENTFFYTELGFENFFIYYSHWKEFLGKNSLIEPFMLNQKRSNNTYRLNIADKFIRWIGKEICLAYTPSLNSSERYYTYALLDMADRDLAKRSIKELINAGWLYSGGSLDTTSIGEYSITRISIDNLLPDVFGSAFADISHPYFCVLENYAVMSSSKDAAEYFVRTYLSGKTLHNNSFYKNISDHIDDKANISLFVNFKQYNDQFKKYFDPILLEHIDYANVALNNIEAFALQFSLNNKQFYTNAYLKYETTKDTIVSTQVKTQLDFDAMGQVYSDKNHENFAVYDKGSNIYLIDANGGIVFKKKIGDVLSGSIDFVNYKETKFLLFNTDRSIHLLGYDGEYAKGFPAKLSSKSSAGHTLANFGNADDYRIIVPGVDKTLYSYNMEGKKTKDWKTYRCNNLITSPPQALLFSSKDFVIVSDEKGKMAFLNRKGEKRFSLRQDFLLPVNNHFDIDNQSKGQYLITTEPNGKVQKIDTKGEKQSFYFDDFSSSHYFYFADFNGDGECDYIFVDKNEIKVFDKDKKVLFSQKMTTLPSFVQLLSLENGAKNILAIIDSEAQEVFLYNDKGLIKLNTSIISQFSILVFSFQGHYKVISVSKNTIYQQMVDL